MKVDFVKVLKIAYKVIGYFLAAVGGSVATCALEGCAAIPIFNL